MPMGKGIVIVDHDPRWPRLYEMERLQILQAIGEHLVALEHIGSTAVPRLGAKPTIDIMAGVSNLDDSGRCIQPLETIGYSYVPEYEEFIPDRRYFRKGPHDARSHHLHMVEHGGDFWERHLLFRDHLRAHPEVARRYERLKRELAPQYTDGNEYADAKTPFIDAVIEEALAAQGRLNPR